MKENHPRKYLYILLFSPREHKTTLPVPLPCSFKKTKKREEVLISSGERLYSELAFVEITLEMWGRKKKKFRFQSRVGGFCEIEPGFYFC